MNDALLPILLLLALSIIVVHITMVWKMISRARWDHYRCKRVVPRREFTTLWLTMVSLVILGLAVVFAAVQLNILF